MVNGYDDTFQSTVTASLNFDQKLDFLVDGLTFKAMASLKNFSQSVQTRYSDWNKFTVMKLLPYSETYHHIHLPLSLMDLLQYS